MFTRYQLVVGSSVALVVATRVGSRLDAPVAAEDVKGATEEKGYVALIRDVLSRGKVTHG
jgi:hypothetical protein